MVRISIKVMVMHWIGIRDRVRVSISSWHSKDAVCLLHAGRGYMTFLMCCLFKW